jgi:hypothetical protein
VRGESGIAAVTFDVFRLVRGFMLQKGHCQPPTEELPRFSRLEVVWSLKITMAQFAVVMLIDVVLNQILGRVTSFIAITAKKVTRCMILFQVLLGGQVIGLWAERANMVARRVIEMMSLG